MWLEFPKVRTKVGIQSHATEARSDLPSKLGNFSRLTPAAFHSPVPHFSCVFRGGGLFH